MRMNWRFTTEEWLKIKKGNRRKSILVVDDEGFLVDILYEILQAQGYSVHTATSGEEALTVARKAQSIDLLLTDLIMKPMNGPELTQKLTATNPQMKVLYMSGYSRDFVAENLGLQNIAYMEKPISADNLLEKISELLGKDPQP